MRNRTSGLWILDSNAHCWSQPYAGCVSYELCNRPHSPQSLCGSVVEHQSKESEGLRCNSSWGLRIFSLYHAHHKTKTIFLYIFTKHLSHSIYKHDAIYIIDPNGMQDVCHMKSFTIESLWLSGRASEHRIRRSEVFNKYLPFHKTINLY